MICNTNIGSVRMSYMYNICCVPFFFFFFKKPHVKNTICKSFPKKTLRLWIWKVRIWSEESTLSVDFMDLWSTFGFAQKNSKSVLRFGNPDLDFPKTTHPKTGFKKVKKNYWTKVIIRRLIDVKLTCLLISRLKILSLHCCKSWHQTVKWLTSFPGSLYPTGNEFVKPHSRVVRTSTA